MLLGKRFNALAKVVYGMLLFAAALWLACSDVHQVDPGVTAPDIGQTAENPWEQRYADRGTPDDLIEYLEHAYRSEYPALYGDALHASFLFEFTPQDAEAMGLPPEAPWWGKMEDMNSTGNMFGSAEVTSIEISLAKAIDWVPCIDIRPGTPPDTLEGLCARFDPYIEVVVEEAGQDPMMLLVYDSWLDVLVVHDPDFPGLWSIARIEEQYKSPTTMAASRSRSILVEPCSWGTIKALFR
jgi:hypothetical protein